jgi:dolichyl-phosphate beta-glucosyltransferase
MIPDISVVLPCYNSVSKIPKSLVILADFLEKLEQTFEIIVSDDGSSDETQMLDWDEYSKLLNVKYIRTNCNRGKGAALRNGFNFCTGKIIFFMDVDLPIQLDGFTRALQILERDEADLVIGDRRISGSVAIGFASTKRFIASKIFNMGVQFIALPGYMDTQCPIKGFQAIKLMSILPSSFLNSFAFDVEIIYLFKAQGYRVRKIPVTWKDDRASMQLIKLTHIVLSCLLDVAKVKFSPRKFY